MKKAALYGAALCIAALLIAVSILGPPIAASYFDAAVLNKVTVDSKEASLSGYAYDLNINEKLYILSNALRNWTPPQSDYYASVRLRESVSSIQTQSYAFQPVYKESEFNRAAQERALSALSAEIEKLCEEGVLPPVDCAADPQMYDMSLFSAIDLLEPKKNVSVWRIIAPAKAGSADSGLVECLMDARGLKVYSFAIRTSQNWDDYDPDEIVRRWSAYLGAGAPKRYTPENPIAEDTPYYQKYTIEGMDGDTTVVTAGFYDGVREFYIKITK